ncbi:MAG: beta-galactosidase [Bryobacteraceae bacterium]
MRLLCSRRKRAIVCLVLLGGAASGSLLYGQRPELENQRLFVNKFFDFPIRGTLNYRPWDFADFTHNVDGTAKLGINTVQFTLPWNRVQPEPDPNHFDWRYLDARLDYLHQKYPDLWVMVILDLSGQSFPPFIDLEKHAMRGIERGIWLYPSRAPEDRQLLTARLAIDSPEVQEMAARYYRSVAAHVRERYGPNHRVVAYEVTLHQNMESDWWGLGPNVDYSDHAQMAFRQWLARQYGDISALRKAWGMDYQGSETRWQPWEIRIYKSFEDLRMTHQTEALAVRVDWLKYKYWSMDRWNKVLRDALRQGDANAALLWRGGGGLLMHERTVLFDFARYMDNVDWVILDDYAADFMFSWVRGSAMDKPWGIEIGVVRPQTTPVQAERTKRIYGQGAAVYNVCRFNSQDVRDPVPFEASLVSDVVALTRQPRTRPVVRRAIYVSTFQTLRDYADFTAAAEAFEKYTVGGHVVDVITDGVVLKGPDRLARYTDGVVVPLAEVLGRDAREALLRAARQKVKIHLLQPKLAGTLDEYLRITPPLAPELTKISGLR